LAKHTPETLNVSKRIWVSLLLVSLSVPGASATSTGTLRLSAYMSSSMEKTFSSSVSI